MKTFREIREHIVKVGDKYRLVSKKTGRNLGTYPSKAGAEKRERQVQYFKHVGENFKDGRHPEDKGDSARLGLKGKSASELRSIRSSDSASPRKKQLAHWLLNFHKEEYPPKVEKNYYKGRHLHFAKGNRGGKSSSSKGGAAASGANGDGGSGSGGNGE